MSVLIKNGNIVTAVDSYVADILVDEGKVRTIGTDLAAQADKTIDATGNYVIPGGVDPHTHLDFPFGGTVSSDDFLTGTQAAAFGGTTTIVDFAVQQRGDSLSHALEMWHAKAEGKAAVDYGFHMIILDLPDSRLPELDEMVRQGVTSFKLFMAYPGAVMADDATIFKAMSRSADNGALVCLHAEHGLMIDVLVKAALADGKTAPKYHATTRPPIAEAEATHRAIRMAEVAGAPVYFVHLSCHEALQEVQAARARREHVYAETCPHYLTLDNSMYDQEGFEGAKYVLTPPLREQWHQAELWSGLKRNDLQVVSTDHAAFRFADQKTLGRNDFSKIPNGGPGIEHRLSLLYTKGVMSGLIDLHRMVDVFSTTPAKLFGLFPRKGTIAVGSDADIVVFHPEEETTISAQSHHMNMDYNMYEGMRVKGVPKVVVTRGEVIIEDGVYLGTPGDGRFLKRGTQA
ncbi:MAG: dihydropyrimidinase [Chloroflexi bacterium]|nr:dihydropyrimidinase [Chloroflexota bacterium]